MSISPFHFGSGPMTLKLLSTTPLCFCCFDEDMGPERSSHLLRSRGDEMSQFPVQNLLHYKAAATEAVTDPGPRQRLHPGFSGKERQRSLRWEGLWRGGWSPVLDVVAGPRWGCRHSPRVWLEEQPLFPLV